MTDGAAFSIRSLKRENSQYYGKDLEQAFEKLTSNDPKKFWTSG